MNKTKVLTTLAIASTLMLATAVTPASARWHGGWGPGAAIGIGAGLALGALGGYGGYGGYPYGYNNYPYGYGGYGGYGSYGAYGAYGSYGGCALQRYWSHGRWHQRYVC
jgi:hypothetical protein